jgi:Delta7-sterol 5-desaturase
VIADEYVDQFVRATPILFFTLIMPMNIDMLVGMFGVFFYIYGIYLHWGYEVPWLDAHHPIINTAFQHYCHHAKSIRNKPYHTGFFLKIWDQLFGSIYPGKCFCCKCERAAGLRSEELFKNVQIPDYTILLKPSFWFELFSADSKAEYETKLKSIS